MVGTKRIRDFGICNPQFELTNLPNKQRTEIIADLEHSLIQIAKSKFQNL